MKFFKITLVALLVLSQSLVFGQRECVLNFDVGADLASRYVWRGTQFGGNSPSIQPYTSVSAFGLEVGAWGAYSLSGLNTGQEFDLYLTYSFLNEMISITATDYYFPDYATSFNYFEFDADKTGHVLEGALGFSGPEKFPLSLTAAVNFYGADAVRLNNDPNSDKFNQKTGIQYSSYLELGFTKSFGDVDLDLFLGATLTSPLEADEAIGFVGESGYYGSKPGIVNTGFTLSKSLQITEKYELPLFGSVIANPDSERIFFVFGFSF